MVGDCVGESFVGAEGGGEVGGEGVLYTGNLETKAKETANEGDSYMFEPMKTRI